MRKIMSAALLSISIWSPGSAFAESCSLGSRESQLAYIQEFASGFPAFTNYVAMGQDYPANDKLASFRGIMENCEATIGLTGMTACFATADRLAKMNSRRRSISGTATQGMEMSDAEYQAQLPDVLKTLPPQLANGLPANWREVAQQNGWQAVTYRSRTVGNPGPTQSFMRVLFKIPGNPYERWIQFTIGELNNPNQPERLIDAIAVNTQTKQISFNQFWRNGAGQDPQPRASGPHGSSGQMDSCIMCHPNGMRELSPAPGSYPKEDAATIQAMNASMQAYKKLNWQGVDMDAYGPPLGQADGCVRCHNGYTGDPAISRGALTVMTDGSNFRHKLVDDMSMSPTTLSDRDEALQYLKNIPFQLPDDERKRMLREVYGGSGGSDFNKTLETLEWLQTNNSPAGTPYLSTEDRNRYVASLREMSTENEAVAYGNPALRPGRSTPEETREWLLKDCEIPVEGAVAPASVVNGDEPESAVETGKPGIGGSGANQQ